MAKRKPKRRLVCGRVKIRGKFFKVCKVSKRRRRKGRR